MGLLEIGLFILFIGLAFTALAALVGIIRVVLVKIAKRNGYSADEMPLVYHMCAFGIYFSIFLTVIAIGAFT